MLTVAHRCRATAKLCPHFCDAAALLRVWAWQHHLSQAADGLNGTLLTMLLVHLLETGQAVSGWCGLPLVHAPAACLPGLHRRPAGCRTGGCDEFQMRKDTLISLF